MSSDGERAEGEGGLPGDALSERELAALHEIEVGAEWLGRAHGHLLAFHHALGHGMDHFAAVEEPLRAEGYGELADRLRDDLLPRGVVDGRWSYEVVEAHEEELLAATRAFERTARERIAGGERHVAERRQQRRWRDRADR